MFDLNHIKLSGKVAVMSDLHLGHNRDFLYSKRNFPNIWTHDKFIASCWREFIDSTTDVINLGDVCFNDSSGERFLNYLSFPRQNLYQLSGNHNSGLKAHLDNPSMIFLGGYATFSYGKLGGVLSHFPFYIHDRKHHGAVNLSGHSHGSCSATNPNSKDFGAIGRVIDCGVESALEYTKGERFFFWLDELFDILKNVPLVKFDHHNEKTT